MSGGFYCCTVLIVSESWDFQRCQMCGSQRNHIKVNFLDDIAIVVCMHCKNKLLKLHRKCQSRSNFMHRLRD